VVGRRGSWCFGLPYSARSAVSPPRAAGMVPAKASAAAPAAPEEKALQLCEGSQARGQGPVQLVLVQGPAEPDSVYIGINNKNQYE